MAVHFVQLTAVRQLWRAGRFGDYRLVWPSPLFAVEYFVWDILVGLTMGLAGFALAGGPLAVHARRALLIGGVLCLVGTAGPLSGWMLVQNVAVLGYAVVSRCRCPHSPGLSGGPTIHGRRRLTSA